jgi:lysophosphatidate acyltransferase
MFPFWDCIVSAFNQVYLANNIFINRSNRETAIQTMGTVAEKLNAQKLALWMYPEGTRTHQRDKTIAPFKKGAFHVAVQGKFPIVPVVCSTLSPFYDEKNRNFESCIIHVKVLTPIIGTDVDDLMKLSHEKMSECLKTLETKAF